MSSSQAADELSDEPSDKELLRRHVAGDADAFGILFGRHRDRLWAIALRTMGNPEDAADGLQDGLIAAYRRAGTFRGDAAVTTWLHRVVVNACLDRIRAAKVRRADALPDDLEEVGSRGSLVSADPGSVVDPADAAVADERRRLVIAALNTLPEDQRASLVLVDMEGYSVAEAAEILDCPVGTVKSRCARGRTKLAGLLGILAPTEPPAAGAGNQAESSDVPLVDPARGPPGPA